MPHDSSSDPFVLRVRDHTFDLHPDRGSALVMGVLNVTPDSFFDGGRYENVDAALRRAEEMLEEGAAVLDVGGESTRPRGSVYGAGAEAVAADAERRRVLPVVEAVHRRFPEAVISIDTYKSAVARDALEAGASIVNDVTGLNFDPAVAEVAAARDAPLVVMHALGTPGAMPHEHRHEDVVEAVRSGLAGSVARAEAAGVRQIVVDPGFGFGKTVAENLRLVAEIDTFLSFGRPILIGLSRKSTIGAVLGTPDAPVPVEERLFGSLGATAVAVLRGARLVRTHDVRPTVEMLRLLETCARARQRNTEQEG